MKPNPHQPTSERPSFGPTGHPFFARLAKRFFHRALAVAWLCVLPALAEEAPLPVFDEAALTTKAEAGDLPAAFQLGRAYLRGEGVPRNMPAAFQWLKTAAEAGHAEAQGAYGFMIAKGLGTTLDEKEGVAWIRRSAAAGVALSTLNLGLMTLSGQGTERDQEAGLALIEKAADQGLLDAQTRLAGIWYFGENGVPSDPAQAAPWALKAAATGDAWAQNLVGAMKQHGLGLPVHLDGALESYRQAAAQGEAKAQSNLGQMLFSGQGAPRDLVRAWYWLRAAADQNEITAINFLKETEAAFDESTVNEAKALLAKEPPPRPPRPGRRGPR